MDKSLLEAAVAEIKTAIHDCVTTGIYNGKKYDSGLNVKNALIRGSVIIQKIHEAAKSGLHDELLGRDIDHALHPPLGQSRPEKDVWGFLKKKKQDIVVLLDGAGGTPEAIDEGPLMGEVDQLGREATKRAIVIGVRSQLSSTSKNFDTLMERAFAETLNLRLRHPYLIMGEVYLLAVKDYDEQKMKHNQIGWKSKYTNIERFISIFNAMSGRTDHEDWKQLYKYERSALLLVDFSLEPPKIYWTLDELREDGIVSKDFAQEYTNLSPLNFSKDLLDAYQVRHADQDEITSDTSENLTPNTPQIKR